MFELFYTEKDKEGLDSWFEDCLGAVPDDVLDGGQITKSVPRFRNFFGILFGYVNQCPDCLNPYMVTDSVHECQNPPHAKAACVVDESCKPEKKDKIKHLKEVHSDYAVYYSKDRALSLNDSEKPDMTSDVKIQVLE